MASAALQQLPLWEEGAVEAAWRVRRSERARRLGVRVFHDGSVEVIVPPRARPSEVQAFVARHQLWIERQRQRIAPPLEAFPPERMTLPALGETWLCRSASAPQPPPGRRRAALAREFAQHEGGGVLELEASADSAALRSGVLDWLAARAGAEFPPRLAALAAGFGCRYQRVQIRRQRTRWGSCSRSGTISLNFCLLFHRPEVLRYLMAHELAHLSYLSHGPRFWGLVARYEPQWQELDRELTRGWKIVPSWLLAALRA